MTTTEPVDALAEMRRRMRLALAPDARIDNRAHDIAAARELAVVVQAEQSTRIADAMERIADALGKPRTRLSVVEATSVKLDEYDALRAEVERIAADAEVDSIVVYREIPGRLRRALEGGE